jgi:hypothetical protein
MILSVLDLKAIVVVCLDSFVEEKDSLQKLQKTEHGHVDATSVEGYLSHHGAVICPIGFLGCPCLSLICPFII